ncbi:hypothetical protein LR48_Vigan03g085700 [Vigna angularis]|uniref:Uncharacterized protein n=1 Tax=Phaseolus angularis TaxID=3914 RepID=A0A0L9U3X1_PHAAN|nr:hypothetical protein LR48_Vigan03g085700 [Vigna angularis]
MHEPVIDEDDEMVEAEDDPLSKLMTRLPRLKRGPLEIYWDLRRFKSTSPILEDTIRQIRQEWTTYLLQRWS